MSSKPKSSVRVVLESELRGRFEKLPDDLPDGELLDLHTAVSQLLYVKQDFDLAIPLLEKLETAVALSQQPAQDAPNIPPPPPMPGQGPPPPPAMPGQGPPPAPAMGGPTAPPAPKAPGQARPNAPQPPGNAYLAKACKEGLRAEMFNLPVGMNASALADVCTRFNFVVKQMGDDKEVILQAQGMLPDRVMTGSFNALELDRKTQECWEALHRKRKEDRQRERDEELKGGPDEERKRALEEEMKRDRDAGLPGIPSVEEIARSAIGWKPGSGVDSIKEHRPSDIGTVKVDLDHPKQAMVKVEALASANRQLADVGSFIRLETAGPPDENGFVRIRPVFTVDRRLTAQGEESHQKLVELNRERQQTVGQGQEAAREAQYVSWADCHRTAQTIMGSEDTASGIGDKERVVMKGLDTLVEPVAKNKIKAIPSASDHGANRAMHGFFKEAMPKLRERLAKKKDEDLSDTEREAIRLINEQMGNPSDDPKNYRAVYSRLCADPDIAREFADEFGINEAIVPKVGTAFAQINDEHEKANAPDDVDLWNFHFAGVVLVNPDGSYMTLENLSVEDTTAVNDDWYFAVYDPKNNKSFHEVNKNDSHVGKSPITLLFDKQA